MPSKYPVETVLNDSERIARVWSENTNFTLGEVTLQNLQAKITDVRQKRDRMEELRMQLTALSNELSEKTSELASINTRARSGFRATYGPNSTQYEQAGGTRASDRRKAARKNAPPATS